VNTVDEPKADQTRVLRRLIGMFGLGVMAASVPGVAHTVLWHGDSVRPLNVFAVAYIATRIYGSQSWRRGEVLLDLPVARSPVSLAGPWWSTWPWSYSPTSGSNGDWHQSKTRRVRRPAIA
jgi:hypothetical protein